MNLKLQLIIPLTLLVMILQGCATTSQTAGEGKRSGESNEKATALIEGFFVVPETNFFRYKKIIVADLNLGNIINPDALPGSEPSRVVLNADQERFYRDQYIGAVVGNLIADGIYTTALDSGEDVLLLNATIAQITPPEQQEKPARNSAAMQAISGRTSTITIVLELYDSKTREMIATFTDTRELGQVWDENSPMGYNMQVPMIFDYWLAYLRKELDELSQR